MKKSATVLTLLALLISLQSIAGIDFIEKKTWKEVLALAKQKKKLIFLDAYAVWCGPCKYLQQNVFTSNMVGNYYNANFINVKIDMEKGEGVDLAEKYNVTSYPTLLFIDGDGKLVHKSIGAMDPEDFLQLGRTASNPSTQFYTLKEKALSGNLDPKTFDEWIHAAQQMEEEGTGEVINTYLAKSKHPLMNRHIQEIILSHVMNPSREHLDYFFKNKKESAKILELTEEEYEEGLLVAVSRLATEESKTNADPKFDVYRSTISRYFPKKAGLKTQLYKVEFYSGDQNQSKTMEAIQTLFTDYSKEMNVEEMALSVISSTREIVKAKKGEEWVKKVNNYQIRVEDKNRVYYKDFALAVIYYSMDDMEKVQFYINRVKKDAFAPEDVKRLAEQLEEE